MGRDVTMEMVVGAFMLTAMLGLGYFTIMLSSRTFFSKKHPMTVHFSQVMGLRDGDSVVIRGMPIGKVEKLALDPMALKGVDVVLSLDHPIQLRRDYRIMIEITSILGGRQLQIYEGSPQAEKIPEGEELKGEMPVDLMKDASEMVAAIRKALVEGGVIDNLKSSVAQFQEIITRVNQGKGTLGRLLSDDDTLYKDLSTTVASLRAISGRLEKGEGTLGKLLSSDDTMYKDLSTTVASLRTISGRLEKGEGTLGKLLSNDDTMYKDLSATVASLRTISERLEKGEGTLGKLLSKDEQPYEDLKAAIASLKAISAKIESGEGSLGKFVKDDALYDDAKGLVNEARAAVDDFRETAPVVSFSSLFFGAL